MKRLKIYLVLIAVFVVIGLNIPLPYHLMKPGNVRVMGEVLKVEHRESRHTFHMVTVLSGKATLYHLLKSMNDPYMVMVPKSEIDEPRWDEEKMKMIEAQKTAQNVSFELLGIKHTPNVYFSLERIVGPSAGLVMSLEMIEQNDGIQSGGLKIAGTGEVKEGGEIEKVGAVELKIIAADRAGMDLFFLPYPNYVDSKGFIDDYETSMKIVPVRSVKDALEYIKGGL